VIQFLAEACPESFVMTAAGGNLPGHQALKSDVMPGVVPLLLGLVPESIPLETRLGLLHFVIRSAEEADARAPCFNQPNPDFLHNNVAALVKALPASLRAKDAKGSLPIHVAVDIATRTLYGASKKMAKLLVELDPGSLLLPNKDGDLPLHIDIIGNDRRYSLRLADFLVERCPEAARVERRNGNLAIHDAIERRMFDVVREIVRHAPDTAGRQGAAGRSPLHGAVALPR
jgi:hypothetical protein